MICSFLSFPVLFIIQPWFLCFASWPSTFCFEFSLFLFTVFSPWFFLALTPHCTLQSGLPFFFSFWSLWPSLSLHLPQYSGCSPCVFYLSIFSCWSTVGDSVARILEVFGICRVDQYQYRQFLLVLLLALPHLLSASAFSQFFFSWIQKPNRYFWSVKLASVPDSFFQLLLSAFLYIFLFKLSKPEASASLGCSSHPNLACPQLSPCLLGLLLSSLYLSNLLMRQISLCFFMSKFNALYICLHISLPV